MADVVELLARFGSPFYVYDLDRVSSALRGLRSVLPERAELYYSLKANPHPRLAEELRLGGCRAEISSVGELRVGVEAGFAGADFLYTGPAKNVGEIATALSAGIRRFSVESLADLRRVGQAASASGHVADCLLRVNSGFSGASSLHMSGGAQFGIDETEVLTDPDRFASTEGTRIVGLHFFSVSNILDADALVAALTESIKAAGRIRDRMRDLISFVDLGGGFAAPYAQPGVRSAYPGLRPALEQALDTHLDGWRRGHPEIAFESGRYLTAECGDLVCTAVERKDRDGTVFVLLDTGIHHLGGMSGLGRLRPAGRPVAATGGEVGEADARVAFVGPLCTPADVLGRSANAVRINGGEVLVFPNVGAYGLTASLIAFLGRPIPPEIVVRGERVVSASELVLTRTARYETRGLVTESSNGGGYDDRPSDLAGNPS